MKRVYVPKEARAGFFKISALHVQVTTILYGPNLNAVIMDHSKSGANLDAAGIFYVVFCSLWTLLLAVGMGFLWRRRNLPLIKIRGIRLSFTAIGFLHTYWMAVQFAYIADPFPAQAQFWIMGIYLPMGIALFHASNSRFLYVAKQQRQFVSGGSTMILDNYKKIWGWKLRSHTAKMVQFIGVGMLLQVNTSRAYNGDVLQLILNSSSLP